MPILSVALTIFMALLTAYYRMRRQIGVAKSDPLQYALKQLVDSFTFQDESLYLMSLLSKLIKKLLELISLLAANGEDVLIDEIKSITNSFAIDIDRIKAGLNPDVISEDQRIIVDEVKRILNRQAKR